MNDTSRDSVRLPARERIIRAAYDLFSRRGVRDVSVDEIIAASGVAIATFYRHFRSKNDLVSAFLNRREEWWSTDAIVSAARQRTADPVGRLIAIFDIFDEWFRRPDFEGDSFVTVLIEMGPEHPLGRASILHLLNVRHAVEQLAREAELDEPEEFSRAFQLLMKGSIIVATMGDLDAGIRARAMAMRLIDEHRRGSADGQTGPQAPTS